MTNNNVNQQTTALISKKNFDLVTCFCVVDDFFGAVGCLNRTNRGRKPVLSVSEYVTICLLGQVYEIGCLKRLYELLRDKFRGEFRLPDYNNFVSGMNNVSVYCVLFVKAVVYMRNTSSGDVCFCDGTKIEVCKIYREKRCKTMKCIATKSKSTTGWWYGLRLHVLSDKYGNLMRIKFTTATTGEREVLSEFLNQIKDSVVVADAGYVSRDLDVKASQNNNKLLTAVRKNMKTLATLYDNRCMNMRSRIETVFDVLKSRYHLVTSLPRSITGYLAHYMRTIFCYVVLG
jgi:Transposase DDE domain